MICAEVKQVITYKVKFRIRFRIYYLPGSIIILQPGCRFPVASQQRRLSGQSQALFLIIVLKIRL
jgi:hypothetical protein